MTPHLCIFEDDKFQQFLPLVYFRPVYNLKCGITSLKDKIVSAYREPSVSLHCRGYLADVTRLRNSRMTVNEIRSDECLFINGRVLADRSLSKKIPPKGSDAVYVRDGQVVAARLSGNNLERLKSKLNAPLTRSDFDGIRQEQADVEFVSYPWEVVHANGRQITEDYQWFVPGTKGKKLKGKVYKGVHLLGKDISVGEGTSIKPGVVIDAEGGPVIIGRNVKVFPQATIIGPVSIGDGSWIKTGAQIYENTTIGPVCKVGGEIEGSIIHGYSNKQHAGFLGHSYLGAWVNLGADTNNSDLKNNYGTVKVEVDGKPVDTGLQFVGLTVGDHSKSGINSMFNTGTTVGVSSNVFGTGFPPKYVPSFTWGGAEKLVAYQIEKAIGVARKVMARRKIEFTPAEETLFRKIFEITVEDRSRKGIPT